MIRRVIFFFIFLLAIALVVGSQVLPARVDRSTNGLVEHAPYAISEEARRLHESLRIVDLHSDTLLWKRDPLKRHDFGHMDLPRLKAGNVKLQVFSATTKSPEGQNYGSNDGDTDRITALVQVQGWPYRTWGSLYERALYQSERLDRMERKAGGEFLYVQTQADLESVLSGEAIGGIYLIEGGHPLEGDIANLDRLFDAGLCVVGLQHFFDNELGGSLHGLSGDGLTGFGREVVARAGAKSMIIDVAHSSEAVVRDVLEMSSRPLIVSHTGFFGACETQRNIPDALMVQIAEAGGLIGVGYWDGAVCDASPKGVARSIAYGIELVGAEHIALGSDYDGATTVYFDTSELAALTQALLDEGVSSEDIRAVMGENAIRFFLENLPK